MSEPREGQEAIEWANEWITSSLVHRSAEAYGRKSALPRRDVVEAEGGIGLISKSAFEEAGDHPRQVSRSVSWNSRDLPEERR
jgi:hypothetical protein